jgi:acyl-CoA dehydrogenase
MDFSLSKEQQDIQRAAREFAIGEFPDRALEFDRDESFDLNLWRKACQLGFVGLGMEEKYGGSGLGHFEQVLVVEEFSAVDLGITQAVLSPAFGSELLSLFGTEEQRIRYIPPLIRGRAIMGTAITESDAGSDVAAAITTAVRNGDEYVINGSKMFITNGTLANYLLVFCLTNPDNPDRHQRFSFFLVETDRPGYEANKLKGKMGLRASDTAEISFHDVRIPATNLVGEEGNGFKELMHFFNLSRVGIAAMGVGISRAALNESINYAKKRKQFGVTIASFQTTQFKIAEMATRIQAAKALCYSTAWLIDNGQMDPALVAMAKWFSGEVAVQCADVALQLHGGYGYLDEYKVQRIYRDAKVLEIYEGTKEIEKLIIAHELLGR